MTGLLKKLSIPLIILYTLFVLFAHIDDHQLEIYDEARRAVNAFEMASGDVSSLWVPTYAGEPDHWGTKPPLLVWCQAMWIKLIGPNELAVRMPSICATLLLMGLLIWWAKRQWKNPLVGALAGLIVVSNWHYMGNHGARSGDFDALLVLFLTVQVMGFSEWVRTHQNKWIWFASAGVLLAGFTKGVVTGFALPGIAIWFLLFPANRNLLKKPVLYLSIGTGLLLVLGYYFIREGVDPGYIDLVKQNELGGRYGQTSEGHKHPWYFYLEHLWKDRAWGIFAGLSLAGAAFYIITREPERRAALASLMAAISILGVVSTAETKLYWYVSPALPLLSILTAGFIFNTSLSLKERYKGKIGQWVAVFFLGGIFMSPSLHIVHRVIQPRKYVETPMKKAPFRDYMRLQDVQPPYTILTRNYNPNARFYVMQAQSKGKEVNIQSISTIRPPVVVTQRPPAILIKHQRVIVCHSETWEYVFERFDVKELQHSPPCKLLVLTERKSR